MGTKSKAIPYVVGLVFSNLAVWLILFTGAFKLLGAPLSQPAVVFTAICLATGVLFFVFGRPSFKSRGWLLVSSVTVGVVMPTVAVVAPAAFCILAGCKGFDMP